MSGMILFPDQPPPPAKPKLSAQQRQARRADQLRTIRLRMLIGNELDARSIMDPTAIGVALGMPGAEAVKLLSRHQWRDGDVALLEAAAIRLGLPLPEEPATWLTGRGHRPS